MALVDSIMLLFTSNSRRLRAVLCVTVAMAIALPLLNLYVIYPAFTELFTSVIEEDAKRLADYARPASLKHTSLTHKALTTQFYGEIYKLETDYNLWKIRVFSSEGEILYSSDPDEIGHMNTHPYFKEVIAKGNIYSKLVVKDSHTLEGEQTTQDVIETYVPFMRGRQFLGALEFYHDITKRKDRLDALILYSTIGMTTLSLSLLVVIALMLKKEAAKTEAQANAAQLKEDVERITRHDLKSPMTSLLNGIEYLESYSTLDEDQASIVMEMRKAANEGINQINRSLDLYRMEVGSYPYAPQDVDIMAVARRVATDLAGPAMARNVTVNMTKNGTPATLDQGQIISAEETLCYSLLANLIKNSIEASKQDDVVTFDVTQNDSIELSVHNPTVVPEEMQDVFFEKYATAGKSTGTGLGTYSAQLMTRTMGGQITMDSSEENGTTVTVTLPRITTPPEPEKEA